MSHTKAGTVAEFCAALQERQNLLGGEFLTCAELLNSAKALRPFVGQGCSSRIIPFASTSLTRVNRKPRRRSWLTPLPVRVRTGGTCQRVLVELIVPASAVSGKLYGITIEADEIKLPVLAGRAS